MSSYPSAGVDAPSAATTDALLAGCRIDQVRPGDPRSSRCGPLYDDGGWRRSVVRGFRRGRRAGVGVAIAIGVVAFTLGVAGYLEAGGVSVATAVYDTLLLFTLNFVPPPDSGQSLPVALEIARFLAPVVTLLAAASLGARLFRDEYDLVATRHRAHGHVVVCGLGHVGSTVVALLRSHGHRVVAIERDRSVPTIQTARSLGVPVVVGDTRAADTLKRAGIARATSLIWSIGDFVDGRAVVTSAAAALRDRKPSGRNDDLPPSCLVRVRDLGLCELLRRDVLVGHGLGGQEPDVDFFNEWENTAQRLLWNRPRGYALADDDVDLWILGGGPLAEAITVQAIRNWSGLPASRRQARLSIHFFDEGASTQRDRFAAVWPEAAKSCTLTAHDGPPELALAYSRNPETAQADAAFVLVDGRDRTVELGLRLNETRSSERVAIAVSDLTGGDLPSEDVTVFDPVNYGLDSDILLLDTYDQLARMIHQLYLEKRLSPDGAIEPTSDPLHPGREWNALAPFWRESNRDAARFIVPNLLASGYDIRRRSTDHDRRRRVRRRAHRRHGQTRARALAALHDRPGLDGRGRATQLRAAHQSRSRALVRGGRGGAFVQLRLRTRLPAPPRTARLSGPTLDPSTGSGGR